MENRKKVLLRAAGFGIGFAVIAAAIIGGVFWWLSRPPKPRPWDEKALTASYESLNTEGDANTLHFVYTVQNNTDADYRVETGSGVHLAALLRRTQALSFSDTENLYSDFPIYIPAKSRVRLQIHLNYPYPIKPNNQASADQQYDFNTNVAKYVVKELGNVDGFVLLDEGSKNKIVMPNGWTEKAKMPMKTKSDPYAPLAK